MNIKQKGGVQKNWLDTAYYKSKSKTRKTIGGGSSHKAKFKIRKKKDITPDYEGQKKYIESPEGNIMVSGKMKVK